MGEPSLTNGSPPFSNGEVIQVALIEDNRLVREGIAALLENLPDLRVVVKGGSADASLLKELNPRVVLLDLGLRQGNSLRLVETVKEECPETLVIVMDLLPVHEDIAEGESNKAIARHLHISPHTVKSHVRNIMEKLTLHTRLQIAAYAHQSQQSEPKSE